MGGESQKNKLSDLPEEWEIVALYHTLKKRVNAVIDRWSAFDEKEWTGKDWSECIALRPQNLPWTLEDAFATFQGISRATGHPCPSRELCASRLGLKSKGSIFFHHYAEIISGLYPLRNDVQNILMLILLRTGWNGEVAIVIDCDNLDSTVRDHPTSEAHSLLYSSKARGNTEQIAHGLKRSDKSRANLIKLLVKRTQPLREFLKLEIASMREQSGHDAIFERLAPQISLLRTQLASAWVHIQRDNSGISTLTSQNYAVGPDGKISAMLDLVQETNRSKCGNGVSEDIRLSDFRDAFISFTYKYSGHSWLEAQLAAGHTSINSLTSYMRKRQWKAYGEGRVVFLFDRFWNEIKTRRIADPSVLRAMCDRGEISEKQRDLWTQHRNLTRVGMGCLDFRRPPKEISPEHVEGDGCRVQRCILCPLGVLVEGSLNHLTRRFSELVWIKQEISLNSWYQSSFPLEVESIEAALTTFDAELAEMRLEYWATEIREYRHRPLSMEGSYGSKGKS